MPIMTHPLVGRRALVGPTLAAVLFAGASRAEPPLSPAPEAPTSREAEAEARAHFKKGNEHFDKQEWLEALGEFRKALALKRTRAAMVDEASCLKQLGRYDEALDAYEALRAEFPVLPPKLEAKVAPAVVELQRLVGTLAVGGDAPVGASVFVDDRPRGRLPLAAPLRVGVGSHTVRLETARFEPLVVAVDVTAGRETTAEPRAVSRKGRLQVLEKHGWALEVELDGQKVGVTPWEGMASPGDHEVKLTGFVGLDALAECTAPEVSSGGGPAAAREGAKMGSPSMTAPVRLYEVTPVTLAAEELDASLRIESTPAGASVTIDGAVLGRTPWEGRLGLGPHTVVLGADGFSRSSQEVRLLRRKQRELQVVLEREPDTARLRRARNVGAGVGYGVGALGLGVFAVAGGLALSRSSAVKAQCDPSGLCAPKKTGDTMAITALQSDLDAARTLGTVSTVGLVVGSVGVAFGTVAVIVGRPRPGWRAGVGLGRFDLEGSF